MGEWRMTGRVTPLGDGSFEVDISVSGDGPTRAKSSKAKVAAPSDEALLASVEEAMDVMGDELALYAEQMVALMATQNKTGKVSLSRAYREVYAPIAAWSKGVRSDAAVYGMTQAVSRGKPNVNYAKKAAESYSSAPAAPVEYTDRYEMAEEWDA